MHLIQKDLRYLLTITLLIGSSTFLPAQYKSFQLTPKGDTINIVDDSSRKQGRWVISVGELRGEPGYEEEGVFKNDKKTGVWRKYNTTGDLIAFENYRMGGKDGIQQYFSFLGVLQKQEEWRGYNPDAPYDTIPVYGTGSNEIIEYKIVKAEQYSVPHGEWKYYNPQGNVIAIERYDRGQLIKDPPPKKSNAAELSNRPKDEKIKPQEVLDYEKKYSKKKRNQMERIGKTSL